MLSFILKRVLATIPVMGVVALRVPAAAALARATRRQ